MPIRCEDMRAMFFRGRCDDHAVVTLHHAFEWFFRADVEDFDFRAKELAYCCIALAHVAVAANDKDFLQHKGSSKDNI